MKCRVYYREDGSVWVTYFVWKLKRPEESESQFMDRLALQLEHRALPYDDMEAEGLPPREKNGVSVRNKWRGAKGRGVWVDESVVTRTEKISKIAGELDAELGKNSPDIVRAMRLQRELNKLSGVGP